MPRRIADWWASFSQGSDHPSSAFNCSKSYRMASRCWRAHCGHPRESRLFPKEQKLTNRSVGLGLRAPRSSCHVTYKGTNLEGTGIPRESCVCIIDRESTAKFCMPAWTSLGFTVRFSMVVMRQTFPVLLETFSSIQATGYSAHGVWLSLTGKLNFFSFCLFFIFIVLNLNRAWD